MSDKCTFNVVEKWLITFLHNEWWKCLICYCMKIVFVCVVYISNTLKKYFSVLVKLLPRYKYLYIFIKKYFNKTLHNSCQNAFNIRPSVFTSAKSKQEKLICVYFVNCPYTMCANHLRHLVLNCGFISFVSVKRSYKGSI